MHIWKYWYHNSSGEAIFENNKIKEEHETMKLQNEDVIPSKHLKF